MKTIQMTIDEALLGSVDRMIGELKTTRSAFIRGALEQSLRRHRTVLEEKRHRDGYLRTPAEAGEFEFGDEE